MAHALRLAERGRYSAHPNPRVGCVLVKDGRLVACGWHRRTGEAHAEVIALQEAGNAAQAATAYVTLEPCSHHGHTPPCADALISAGVARVVIAMEDPNPKVSGSGIAKLRGAGIAVAIGLMADKARALNAGFVSRVTRGRPFLRLKIAASLDGATAMRNGDSQWITGEDARRDVQRMRAASGAVMTGVATVIDDDPSLTVRGALAEQGALQPLRAVLDSRLRMPAKARLLGLPGETVIYCLAGRKRAHLGAAGVTLVEVGATEGRTALPEVLADLATRQVNDVLVEAGPTLAGALLTAGLVDELVIYQAPHIMGSETRGIALTPSWTELAHRLPLCVTDVRKIGSDTRITAIPAI